MEVKVMAILAEALCLYRFMKSLDRRRPLATIFTDGFILVSFAIIVSYLPE